MTIKYKVINANIYYRNITSKEYINKLKSE